MQEGCPLDLKNPLGLYEKLKCYLNGLGQRDGYWSPSGEVAIPVAFPESQLAQQLQEYLNPGYVARASRLVSERYSDIGGELIFMVRQTGFEFANGWKIFPAVVEESGTTEWFVTGMLFPRYDGETEGWVIWAHASEVFF